MKFSESFPIRPSGPQCKIIVFERHHFEAYFVFSESAPLRRIWYLPPFRVILEAGFLPLPFSSASLIPMSSFSLLSFCFGFCVFFFGFFFCLKVMLRSAERSLLTPCPFSSIPLFLLLRIGNLPLRSESQIRPQKFSLFSA